MRAALRARARARAKADSLRCRCAAPARPLVDPSSGVCSPWRAALPHALARSPRGCWRSRLPASLPFGPAGLQREGFASPRGLPRYARPTPLRGCALGHSIPSRRLRRRPRTLPSPAARLMGVGRPWSADGASPPTTYRPAGAGLPLPFGRGHGCGSPQPAATAAGGPFGPPLRGSPAGALAPPHPTLERARRKGGGVSCRTARRCAGRGRAAAAQSRTTRQRRAGQRFARPPS